MSTLLTFGIKYMLLLIFLYIYLSNTLNARFVLYFTACVHFCIAAFTQVNDLSTFFTTGCQHTCFMSRIWTKTWLTAICACCSEISSGTNLTNCNLSFLFTVCWQLQAFDFFLSLSLNFCLSTLLLFCSV